MKNLLFDDQCLTVTDLTRKVKALLESCHELQNIMVKGEVSNFRRPSSGHLYFTLKDEKSRIRCVMFRSRANKLRFNPEDGLTVFVSGSVSVYEVSGEYQLYVHTLYPAGEGALYLAFKQLQEKLNKEGLFDQKRILPFFPKKIALITSPTGAAVRDIINVLNRRNPAVDILLIPAVVQGENAASSIVQALEIAQDQDIDLIILGRGGGSLEELWAFNEEIVARAVYNSKIPTISAVGHETDFTISDFVADCRAPTPSAAAELAAPELQFLKDSIMDKSYRSHKAAQEIVKSYREKVRMLYKTALFKKPDSLINQTRQNIDDLIFKTQSISQRILSIKRSRLEVEIGKLDSLSPLATLKRGYAICTKAKTEEIVKDPQDVLEREQLLLKVAKGDILCQAIKNQNMEAK